MAGRFVSTDAEERRLYGAGAEKARAALAFRPARRTVIASGEAARQSSGRDWIATPPPRLAMTDFG
jgi:hypothetical protein